MLLTQTTCRSRPNLALTFRSTRGTNKFRHAAADGRQECAFPQGGQMRTRTSFSVFLPKAKRLPRLRPWYGSGAGHTPQSALLHEHHNPISLAKQLFV
jgi:hypothetical protein